MAENKGGCSCGSAPSLIFPCSGAADVGEIADRAARKLTREGAGVMFCLAGIGAHINNFLMSTSAAGNIFVIDGCTVDCGKKILEHAGFNDFIHIRVTDYGFIKGKSPATDETIDTITAIGKTLLLNKGCCS